MTLEVLISCMHQTDMSLVDQCNCNSDVLIINQTDHEGFDQKKVNGHNIRMYSTTQRGLSRSRNMALIHAKGDICLISDDDVVFEDNYVDTIIGAFERNPKADIIAFDFRKKNQRESVNKNFKKEGPSPRFTFYSSVSLAFRREIVIKQQVYFDVRLGTGSGFISAGEDGAWQRLAQKKGLHIYQSPHIISTVDFSQSSWFKGYNEKYFYDLGANLYVKFPNIRFLFMLYYIWRLRHDATIPKIKQIKYLIAGMKGFSKDLSYEDFVNQYDLK